MIRSDLRLLPLAALLLAAACKPAPVPAPTPVPAPPLSAPEPPPPAQPTALPADATQADLDLPFLEAYARTWRFTLGQPTRIRPAADGTVLFLRSKARSFVQDLYEYDPRFKSTRVVLTAARLLQGADEQLSAEEKARRERMRQASRGIASFELSKDGRRLLIPLSGRLFVVDRGALLRGEDSAVQELPSRAGPALDARFSPDATRVACVRDGDLYVHDVATRRERRLTTRRGPHEQNGVAEFVAQEEMGRMHGYWWAPDGTRLLYAQVDTSAVEVLRIGDPMDPSRAPDSWPYPRPGKANAVVRLGVVGVEGSATTWLDWPRDRYPYLAAVTWTEGAPPTLLVQDRRQAEEVLYAADPASGQLTQLLVERDAAWLNLFADMPRWLEGGDGFLWLTERRGDVQLELRRRDGSLAAVLTRPGFGLRAVDAVDAVRGEVLVQAAPDPTRLQVFAVPLAKAQLAAATAVQAGAATPDPSEPSPPSGDPPPLFAAPGQQRAAWSPDARFAVVTHEPPDGPRRFEVRQRDGTAQGELASEAEPPPFWPQVEQAVADVPAGADGDARTLHAQILRPRAFQKGHKYPVVLAVYGGPHHQQVTASPSRLLLDQWLADRGFVVVRLDGRGTPGRGRTWERALRGDLGQVPVADQVAGLRALAATRPELDLTRVGVYGWSFGGYLAALLAMQHPELVRAAVAGAPVTDWRDYDTHYTERYLGLPDTDAAAYDRSSLLTHAPKLRQPLLLIHGTADDNVYFLHGLKLSDALFRAGAPHEFLPLAGQTHMVPDPLVAQRLYTRIAAFLQRELQATR